MDYAEKSDQLFSFPVNQFIQEQTEKLPFETKHDGFGRGYVVYERRSYYDYSSLNIDNSVNLYTAEGLKAQNQRNNRTLAFIIASIVTTIATILVVKFYHENKAINEDINDIKEFKYFLGSVDDDNAQAHLHALKKVVKLRLQELDSAKAYVQSKLVIVISALASGIFLGIAALAAPELMVIGAIVTGISLLAGVFAWSFEYYDKSPKKIAKKVRSQLDFLKAQTQPISIQTRVRPAYKDYSAPLKTENSPPVINKHYPSYCPPVKFA